MNEDVDIIASVLLGVFFGAVMWAAYELARVVLT